MNRHTWSALIEPNQHGECAIHDIERIVECLERSLQRRKLVLDLPRVRLIRQILSYLTLREAYHSFNITNPRHVSRSPTGWTEEDEAEWQYYLDKEFSSDMWQQEILDVIFGTDVRTWEAPFLEWRMELYGFLPLWIQRSASHLYPEDEETKAEDVMIAPQIDAYILEHGTAKQKKTAMRQAR